MFLPAVRAVLAVLGLAADELAEEFVALVTQLLVDANLGGVIAVDRRLLGHHEKLFERRPRRPLVAADVAQDLVSLRRRETDKRRSKSRRRLGVERRETANPAQRAVRFQFAHQQIDVVGDARLACAGRTLVGRNTHLDQRLE